jgi:hypothetical protein
MIIYHGTNARTIEVIDSPKATKNINGLAFYGSRDIEVARKHGGKVVAWDIDEDMVEYIERPIDQSYVDGISSYEMCALGGMEIVMSQVQATSMAYLCNDAYLVIGE